MHYKYKIFISFTWGIIQSLIGYIVYLLTFSKNIFELHYNGSLICFINSEKINGVSLGYFIFLNKKYMKEKNMKTVKHEYGHYVQSLIFGFFYLIVIGIPSFINNRLSKYNFGDYRKNYYKKYPEAWADILGNVGR